MKVRVTSPTVVTSIRGEVGRATLHFDGVVSQVTGEPRLVAPILLDDHNIDELMAALEPIFEVRKRARSLQQVRKRGLEQADQAQASLDAIQYPV